MFFLGERVVWNIEGKFCEMEFNKWSKLGRVDRKIRMKWIGVSKFFSLLVC